MTEERQRELIKLARKEGVSVYRKIKQEFDFRRVSVSESKRCTGCVLMRVPRWRSGEEGMQCEAIGVFDDPDAWVYNDTVCRHWSNGKKEGRKDGKRKGQRESA